MEDKLNEIKDTLYEAEGLLELARLRQDRLRELLVLAERKAVQVLSLLKDMESSLPAETEAEQDTGKEAGQDSEQYCDEQPEALYEVTEVVTLAEPDSAVVSETSADEIEMDKPGGDARQAPVFCLNDRFRFRRAIFGGSDADFNAAMNHLAALDSYEEAEEYFFGDAGLNPADQDVTDFMEIIKKYFGK